jgi:hypothetical protein
LRITVCGMSVRFGPLLVIEASFASFAMVEL